MGRFPTELSKVTLMSSLFNPLINCSNILATMKKMEKMTVRWNASVGKSMGKRQTFSRLVSFFQLFQLSLEHPQENLLQPRGGRKVK